MKIKDLQPRLLYPARLSLKIEWEVKSLSDKKNLKKFVTIKPVLQEMLKGLLDEKGGRGKGEKEKKKKEEGKEQEEEEERNIVKMTIALAALAQWVEHQPGNQTHHWVDSQSGYMPGLWARSAVGGVWKATDQCFSHTSMFLSLSPFPSL